MSSAQLCGVKPRHSLLSNGCSKSPIIFKYIPKQRNPNKPKKEVWLWCERLINKVWEWQHLTYITGACSFTEVFNKNGNWVQLKVKTTVDILLELLNKWKNNVKCLPTCLPTSAISPNLSSGSNCDGPFGEERPHLETFFFHPVFF